MLRSLPVLVIGTIFVLSLLMGAPGPGSGPYTGDNRYEDIISDSMAVLRELTDSVISRVDSLVELYADSAATWDFIIAVRDQYQADSALTWQELTAISATIDSLSDTLSIIYTGMYANDADVDRIDVTMDSLADTVSSNYATIDLHTLDILDLNNDQDSLESASAGEDADLHTRIDSVRDNPAASGGGGDPVDTTLYDIIIADSLDLSTYTSVANFSELLSYISLCHLFPRQTNIPHAHLSVSPPYTHHPYMYAIILLCLLQIGQGIHPHVPWDLLHALRIMDYLLSPPLYHFPPLLQSHPTGKRLYYRPHE